MPPTGCSEVVVFYLYPDTWLSAAPSHPLQWPESTISHRGPDSQLSASPTLGTLWSLTGS